MRTIAINVADIIRGLDPWQRAFHRAKQRHRLAVVSRRAGKTYLGAKIAVVDLLKAKKLLWVAPAYKQLPENYEQVRQQLDELGLIKKCLHNEQIITKTRGVINFDQSKNHASLRGKGYDTIIYDEMAFAEEAAWTVLRPTLADTGTGRLVGLTTPNGVGTWFHNLYLRAKEDITEWHVFHHDWTCCPRLTAEEMEKVKRDIGESRFQQEMMAVFTTVAGTAWPFEWLDGILIPEIPTDFDHSCISVDLSLGFQNRSDYQAVAFVGWHGPSQSYYVNIQQDRMPLPILMQCIKRFADHQNPTKGVVIEKNCNPNFFIQNFRQAWAPGPAPMVYGWAAKGHKVDRISRLGYWLEQRKLKILRNAGGELLWRQLSMHPLASEDKNSVASGGCGDDGSDTVIQGIEYINHRSAKG